MAHVAAAQEERAALQQLLASERTQHRDSVAALQVRASDSLAVVQRHLDAALAQSHERGERLESVEAEHRAAAVREQQMLLSL